MSTTVLAVDDSKTLRRVLEITFAGSEFRTVLADSAGDALTKLQSESPTIALIDANLGQESGYELCQRFKERAPNVPVVILSSKQQPYDRARGATAGADDFMDKPFDTQQLIDKVSKIARGAATGAVARPAPAAPAPRRAPTPEPAARPAAAPRPQVPAASPMSAPAARPAAVAGHHTPAARPAPAPGPGPGPMTRPGIGIGPAAGPRPGLSGQGTRPLATPSASRPGSSPHAAPAPAPTVTAPTSQAVPDPVAARPAPVAAAVAAAGLPATMQGTLEQLGLTAQQIEGVLALSREVVEKVVWEVVPVLAETLIKEEIQRLTAD